MIRRVSIRRFIWIKFAANQKPKSTGLGCAAVVLEEDRFTAAVWKDTQIDGLAPRGEVDIRLVRF